MPNLTFVDYQWISKKQSVRNRTLCTKSDTLKKKNGHLFVGLDWNRLLCDMGKFVEQQVIKKEQREKNKVRRETLGKFFYDLAKLSFAGLAIGWITPIAENHNITDNVIVLLLGVSFTIIFSAIGDKILK